MLLQLVKKRRQADLDIAVKEFDKHTWNRYLLLGFLSALIPFNTLTNPELRRILFSLKPDVNIPSVSTLRRLLSTEYEKTTQAIRDNIPEGQKVGQALDGWTSGNKLAISSVIMYYISKNWELKEVQLAFEEVCGLCPTQYYYNLL